MNILTISEAVLYLKAILEINEVTNDVWLSGEVSGCRRYGSGHTYFTLKDEGGQVRCVLFRGDAVRQKVQPADGGSFVMHGHFSIYEERGDLQFYVDLVQPSGVGKLHLEFEALKQRLEDEGLFAPERKRPLPPRPKVIGVVCSPQAAAFQDILKVLGRRYPLAEVVLSPTLVQGDSAPPQIVAAIQALNQRDDIDVMIVARGGGSIEELWAFNDERVARAIFASRIPVITGVGHEIDYTIVDFVSDVRAPTPSAAAEIISPDLSDLRAEVAYLRENLLNSLQNELDEKKANLQDHKRRLQYASPSNRLASLRQNINQMQKQSALHLQHQIALHKSEIRSLQARLHTLNPYQILERGYAIVTNSDGQVIQSASAVHSSETLSVQVADGQFKVRAE